MRVQLRKTLPEAGKRGMEFSVWRIRSLDSAVQMDHEEVTGVGVGGSTALETGPRLNFPAGGSSTAPLLQKVA